MMWVLTSVYPTAAIKEVGGTNEYTPCSVGEWDTIRSVDVLMLRVSKQIRNDKRINDKRLRCIVH